MKREKTVLGRGLGAILEEVEEAYIGNIDDATIVREIAVDEIDANPYQPRKYFDNESLGELANSIKEHGLIQPIVVVKRGNKFVLLAGERRLRASKLAKLTHVKAVVADIHEQKMRELAIIENIQRENLNPIDLAQSLQELINQYNVTHEAIADILKKSRSFVTNTLRLLTLDEYIQNKVSNASLSYGHAKTLVGLSPDEQRSVADTISGQKLNVRDTEQLVAGLKNKNNKTNPLDFKKLITYIESCTSAKIKRNGNSLNISFASQNEIESFEKLFSKQLMNAN